jgi:hypothetical protein
MNLSMNVWNVTLVVSLVIMDMTITVPVVKPEDNYITDLVLKPVQLVTILNLEIVTKSVTLVILTVNIVTVVMLTVVMVAQPEDSYIWDSVLKFAQPKCSLTPLTELVNGVTNTVVNVPDNTKVNVPNVMPQDTNTQLLYLTMPRRLLLC